jgi:hypothetical protein
MRPHSTALLSIVQSIVSSWLMLRFRTRRGGVGFAASAFAFVRACAAASFFPRAYRGLAMNASRDARSTR